MRTVLVTSTLSTLVVMGSMSCVHSPETDPPAPLHMPTGYGESSGEDVFVDRWWQSFDDSDLNLLMKRALSDNLRLREGWARLAQVEAIAQQSGSGLWPRLGLDLSASRSQRVMNLPGPTGDAVSTTIESSAYEASIGASYEIDLWGKIRSQKEAAALDAHASRNDLEAMAMSVTAQVAETWFNLVAARAQVALLEEQRQTNEQLLEIIELRFQQGLTSVLDVYQQRQQVASSTGLIENAEMRRRVLEKQLAVLVGEAPAKIVSGGRLELPSLPALPDTGVPADLLQNRPDVRAARLRVVSADYRVGVAIADILPSLRLSASIGFGASTLTDLFENLIWSAIGSISQSLFEGGRKSAEIDRTRAALQEKLHSFGRVMIDAMFEVESALVSEEQQNKYITALDQQATLARHALTEARNRYTQGLDDFLRVLNALQAVQHLEQGQLDANRQLLAYRVQLSRSLGGGWTQELSAPTAVENQNQDQVDPQDSKPDATQNNVIRRTDSGEAP